MTEIKDISGQKFGRLTAIKITVKNKRGTYYWLCKCDCGNTTEVVGSNLRYGTTKSCGCLKKEVAKEEHTTHNMINTSTYIIWKSMRQRCSNKKNIGYKNYGGRGITVCKRWNKFENFFEDMGERPKGLQIDRINNDKDYSKNNCKWSTRKENNRNRRDNHIINYKNKTLCVTEWAERLNIKYSTLTTRLGNGWSIEKAFTK